MRREYLIEKYNKFGEEWKKLLLARELKKIDEAESKEKAFKNLRWWEEFNENNSGNYELSEVEQDKYSDKAQMYAELASLDEFKGIQIKEEQ